MERQCSACGYKPIRNAGARELGTLFHLRNGARSLPRRRHECGALRNEKLITARARFQHRENVLARHEPVLLKINLFCEERS